MHKYSDELLRHYQCCKCEQWWTIGDPDKIDWKHKHGKFMHLVFCPACGHGTYAGKKEMVESVDATAEELEKIGFFDE